MLANAWSRKISWTDYKLLACKFRSISSRWKDKFYVFLLRANISSIVSAIMTLMQKYNLKIIAHDSCKRIKENKPDFLHQNHYFPLKISWENFHHITNHTFLEKKYKNFNLEASEDYSCNSSFTAMKIYSTNNNSKWVTLITLIFLALKDKLNFNM